MQPVRKYITKLNFSNGLQKVSKFIATVFFAGFVPVAPGTVGSLLAIPVYLLVKDNTILHLSVAICLLLLGFWSAGRALQDFSRKDPPEIIIDEFSSMLIVYLFIPFSVKFLIIGFLLFRFFDIFKIPPIKKLEALPQGYGIMLDDIAAAILANTVLQALKFFPWLY